MIPCILPTPLISIISAELFGFNIMRWWRLSFITYIIYFFLFFTFIEFTEGLQDPQLCNPSSCGGLQIQYPFRLKGDPINCGNPSYEFTCTGNRTFMELQSGQFLVKNIDYAGSIIQVVEVGLLRSNCSLPLKSLAASAFESSRYYQLEYWRWISLMNCSKTLASQKYQLIPCLSKKDSYVYAVSSYFVLDLAPSCSLLSMMPSIENLSSHSDLFKAIHEGFSLSWSTQGFTTSMLLRQCLRDYSSSVFHDNFKTSNFLTLIPAVYKAEMHLIFCLNDYNTLNSHFELIFHLSIVVIVMIEIVQLVIVFLLVGRLVFAPLTLCIFLAHKYWAIRSSEDAVEKFLQTQQSLSPTRYAYTDIIAITRHFKEQLGRGGFGSVYKGELPGGHFVAVKLLDGNSKCYGDDFISEVSTIGRIHHLNVVRLVGFCSEGSKSALIYEYMPNKSLDKYIFSSNRYFSWQKLSSIALGVARGIDYLHRGCDMTILHFDIKPQNILLDQSFIPKVSDFGLAKLYPKEYNVVSVSAARGTIGYIAPELVSRNFGVISHKSDVYSFGMLLMEMAAGRRNVDTNVGSSSQNYYPSVIYDKLNAAAMEGINFESYEMNEVEKKLYLVGLWCIQIRPSDRPSMNQVVQMIEGDADALEFPPKPFISWPSSISRTLQSDNTATTELTVIDEDDSS